MTPNFNLGRQYERQEVCALLAFLLAIEDDTQLRNGLQAWFEEVVTTLPQPVGTVVEETYVVV